MAAGEKIHLTDPAHEAEQARRLAMRYRCEFVDLREVRINPDLFHSVPVDMMFRYSRSLSPIRAI
jgi:type IV pilus assembly protein PilB